MHAVRCNILKRARVYNNSEMQGFKSPQLRTIFITMHDFFLSKFGEVFGNG